MGNIKSFIYNNCDEGQKYKILTGFKKLYLREDVSELYFYKMEPNYNITIILENKEIIFTNQMEFIDFMQNLCRPFIIIEHHNYVYFVYN